jgi:excisionase family DNA binding protein
MQDKTAAQSRKVLRSGASAPVEVEERDYLTVREAARLLRVSSSTIWRWIEARRLPAYRVGPRAIRIKKADLESVLTPVHPESRGRAAIEENEDIWAGYDPEEARRLIRETAGSWSDIDADALIADIHRAREAGSRPPDRP